MNSIDDLLNDLKRAQAELPKKEEQLMSDIADKGVECIQEYTPVKTGQLQASYQIQNLSSTHAEITNPISYAVDVEEGHIQHKHYVPALGKTVGEKFVPGSHMMQKGLIELEGKADTEVDKFLNDIELFR